MFRYLPERASDFAHEVDWVNNIITDISVFFTVAIVGAMIYFAVKYRKKGAVDHETPQILGSHTLEVLWTVVPTLICIYIAYWGTAIYNKMVDVPKGAHEINVWGEQWLWRFEYANGKKTVNEFYTPVDEPVRLIINSKDVLHSFFIPSMRVKKDAVPGQYTSLWFRPIKTGTYQAYCTEYCGTQHSAMLAKVHVVSKEEYSRWLNDRSAEEKLARMSPAELGEKLFNENGCTQCHSIDGSRKVGPSMLNLFGKEEELVGGKKVKVDEAYLQKAILNPNAEVVLGYAPVMPPFEEKLTSEQVGQLIAYIKTVKGEAAVVPAAASAEDLAKLSPADRGKKLYEQKACVGCHSLDGSKVVGPSFKGLYGRSGKLQNGATYTADDAYIKSSILAPASQVVEGYPPAMPAYEGQLNDDEIASIIEFIKTLK